MNVVVALILNDKTQVLITQRGQNKPLAYFWEFPGGKVKKNEKFIDALSREIYEELDLTIKTAHYLGPYLGEDTQNIKPLLHVYYVTLWTGAVYLKENQLALSWVKIEELVKTDFPMANWPIIDDLQKIVTPEVRHPERSDLK